MNREFSNLAESVSTLTDDLSHLRSMVQKAQKEKTALMEIVELDERLISLIRANYLTVEQQQDPIIRNFFNARNELLTKYFDLAL